MPGTPEMKHERKEELKAIQAKENIITLLSGWSAAMHHEIPSEPDAVAFLLELNASKRMLKVEAYREDEMMYANAELISRERATENDPNVQVVLVTADSVAALQRAYPNFYVDTAAFIEAVQQEIY